MKEQIIQLEPHDDVVSVLDRLGWLRANRVLLVLPQDSQNRALQRSLDFVLIQRELTRRRAQWAIITDDPVVIDHATNLGIPTFLSIADSHRQAWRSRPARITIRREDQPRPFDPALAPFASRQQLFSEASGPRRSVSIIGFTIAFLALLAVAYVVLPSATVTLVPATNQVSVAFEIVADPNLAVIDFDNSLIPARIVGVEVEDSAIVETTATKDVPALKSTGVVTFINQAPEETTVPAGTVVRTTAGNPVRFVTTAPITLSSTINATADAPIEAIEPGVSGNLPSNLINSVEGPLSNRVRVINSAPVRGGDVRQVPAVSQDDYTRLRAALLQQLQQRAYAEMTGLVSETEFIVTESLAVVLVQDETYNRFVGEESDTVSLEMRVVVQGVIIDERSARQVALNELARQVGPSFEVGQSTLVFRRGEVTGVDPADRRVTFLMQGGGDVAVAIDTARVQQIVQGASVTEAQFLLEQELPLHQAPTIEVRPGFLGRLPLLVSRINIEIVSPT
jgi:hypothetical protein